MEREAAELFEEFKELTASEFFRRNKQMLGFSGKIRSLTIVFHELITNSLDAAEEAGILPEIKIDLKRLEKDHYILRHKDNGRQKPIDSTSMRIVHLSVIAYLVSGHHNLRRDVFLCGSYGAGRGRQT